MQVLPRGSFEQVLYRNLEGINSGGGQRAGLWTWATSS